MPSMEAYVCRGVRVPLTLKEGKSVFLYSLAQNTSDTRCVDFLQLPG